MPSVPEPVLLPQRPSTSGNTNVTPRRCSKRKSKNEKTSTNKPPKTNKPPPKKRKVTKTIVYKWKRTQFLHRAEISEDKFGNDITPNKTALQYFYDFFSEEIIESIVHNTNLYSVQEKGRSINITIDEMRDFLAIELMMGIVKAPSYLDYWAARTRCPFIADVMPLKRYESIRRYIHFADNTNTANSLDPFLKVRPFIESIRQNCLAVEEENKFSIDEMVIPYKGRKAGKKKQYNPQKPRKWGFKNIVRAGASGIVYDFFLYCGDDSFKYFDVEFDDDETDMGWGGKAVLALCKSIKKKACVVYFDNFFSSLPLVQLLRQKYGIFSLGTIRANRLKGCQELLPDDKSLMKKGRGASSQIVDNENQLAIVKWYDNKCVTLISSYVDSHPIRNILRYDKKVKARVLVDFPQIVKHYNAHMGGVDLADMLIALYRTEMKTRRWYLSIFSQMIDICVNNAWLTYRRDLKKIGTKPKKLKHFRMDISEDLRKFGRFSLPASEPQLSESKKIANPRRNRPCVDVRFDNIGHNQAGTTYGRCRFCKKGQTNVFCTKCQMRLCFIPNKRNCFYNYHIKEQ